MSDSTTREKKKLGSIYKIKVDKDTGKITQYKWEGGDQYKEVEFDFVGHIAGFLLGDFVYKNKTKYKISIKLQKGSDVSIIELGFNYLAKNLINYLHNVTPGDHIELSFYTKGGFAKVAVTVGGEKGTWHLTPAQVEKMNEHGDEKWLVMAKKVAEKYVGFTLSQPETTGPEVEEKQESNIPEILKEDDDDLPF